MELEDSFTMIGFLEERTVWQEYYNRGLWIFSDEGKKKMCMNTNTLERVSRIGNSRQVKEGSCRG